MRDAAVIQQSPVVEKTPLCVDLDGSLVKSDTLVDSLLVLLRTRPMLVGSLLGKLTHGKAAFKAFVSESITLDVTHLPYNQAVLHYLQQQHAEGRKIYLATGADERLARRVAAHLGIFTGVLSSDGTTNLIGANKLDRLRSHFEGGQFSYIGNARPDGPCGRGHGGQSKPGIAHWTEGARHSTHTTISGPKSSAQVAAQGGSSASVGQEPAHLCALVVGAWFGVE